MNYLCSLKIFFLSLLVILTMNACVSKDQLIINPDNNITDKVEIKSWKVPLIKNNSNYFVGFGKGFSPKSYDEARILSEALALSDLQLSIKTNMFLVQNLVEEKLEVDGVYADKSFVDELFIMTSSTNKLLGQTFEVIDKYHDPDTRMYVIILMAKINKNDFINNEWLLLMNQINELIPPDREKEIVNIITTTLHQEDLMNSFINIYLNSDHGK